MVRQVIALALASLLPCTLAQISDDFEAGWNQTAWPIYAPDCNQGGAVTLDSSKFLCSRASAHPYPLDLLTLLFFLFSLIF